MQVANHIVRQGIRVLEYNTLATSVHDWAREVQRTKVATCLHDTRFVSKLISKIQFEDISVPLLVEVRRRTQVKSLYFL